MLRQITHWVSLQVQKEKTLMPNRQLRTEMDAGRTTKGRIPDPYSRNQEGEKDCFSQELHYDSTFTTTNSSKT